MLFCLPLGLLESNDKLGYVQRTLENKALPFLTATVILADYGIAVYLPTALRIKLLTL